MRVNSTAQAGFSLIELAITVAVAALLAAIAVPNYQRFIVEAHRGEAKTVLLDAAHSLERAMTASSSYMPGNAVIDLSRLGLDTAPKSAAYKGIDAKYAVSYAQISASAFVLQASPIAPFVDSECDVLTVSSTGVKNATGSAAAARCWGQ
jgi:type IV pilus assembly protein PilE